MTEVNRYAIERELGSGGMATVQLAEERNFCCKSLDP